MARKVVLKNALNIFIHIHKIQNFITFDYYKNLFLYILIYEHLTLQQHYVNILYKLQKSKLTRINLAQSIKE